MKKARSGSAPLQCTIRPTSAAKLRREGHKELGMLDAATEGRPLISVVIPTYRSGDFVSRAIDSALAQEGVRCEVVIVDDASPDDTADLVEARYGSRPDVVLVRLPANGGPSAARNAGMREARGDWIAVLDADDAFDQGRLLRLLSAAQRLDADVVADNIRYYDAAARTLSEPKLRSVKEPLLLTPHLLVAKSRPASDELNFGLLKPFYRRAFLVDHGLRYPENIRHGEDFRFYFDLLMSGARFFVLPEAGYQWTLRRSGQSRTRVDYLGQSEETARLADTPAVRADPTLSRLLTEHSEAMKQYHRYVLFREAGARRDYGQVLTLGLQSPGLVRQMLWRAAKKRLKNRLRLSA